MAGLIPRGAYIFLYNTDLGVLETKRNGTKITTEELKKILIQVAKETDKKFDDYKIRVRALNPVQWMTLKGYSQDELNLEDAEDYMDGKVSDAVKFTEFFQVEICYMKLSFEGPQKFCCNFKTQKSQQ